MQLFIALFQQFLFASALIATGIIVAGRVGRIAANIKRGKTWKASKDRQPERLRNMFLMAFGQKKMFDKPVVGSLHLLVYGGFILINIEILEIVLDGLFGTHRLFAPFLGGFYTVLIGFFELLALGVIFACAVFLFRRNSLLVPRFQSRELKGFPFLDGNTILITEIVLMIAILSMNATDSILQTRTDSNYISQHYYPTGTFLFSQFLIPIFENLSTTSLIYVERLAWWFHILGIFAFSIYVTFSKHLHIVLAFPNTYFANLDAKGKMPNMEIVTREVKSMLGIADTTPVDAVESTEISRFGAKDATDLTWKNLMDAYACTECGRCTASCPANITGKKLSPRKIMMDTRDRIEEMGENPITFDDGKSLYGDYISKEEIMACTTCNACVDACPVNINPLDIILQVRQYIAMEESGTPASWNSMFANMENNAAPWAFSASDRFLWAND